VEPRKDWLVLGIVVMFCLGAIAVLAQEHLDFKDRGDRFEGIEGEQKSAKLKLLSAAVLYEETAKPESNEQNKAHLRFYQPRDLTHEETIFIKVHEFKYHDYSMIPKQKKAWQKQGLHTFPWPMEAVLRHLKPRSRLHQLGAVALIGGEYSNDLAPIVLYQNTVPPKISAYRFCFLPTATAEVVDLKWTWHHLGENSTQLLEARESPTKRLRGGKPFYIDWQPVHDGEPLSEGWYKLSISGTIETNVRDETLDKFYRLYHRGSMLEEKE